MHPQFTTNIAAGYNSQAYQPSAPTEHYFNQFTPAYSPTYLQTVHPMPSPAYYQEHQQPPTVPVFNRQVTDLSHLDTGRMVASAPLLPLMQPIDYNNLYRYPPIPQLQPVFLQVTPPPVPTGNAAATTQATAPEFVAVAVATHERTNRLINKINRIAAPHLPTDLRPTLTPEAANETYESLKGEWRANQNLYPSSYVRSVNNAIREAEHIVNNAQTKRSRVRTFVIALLVLGGLALAAAVFKERVFIDPKKMTIVKFICKIVAAIKLTQLTCSSLSRANEVAAARSQLHIGRAQRNTDLVIGN